MNFLVKCSLMYVNISFDYIELELLINKAHICAALASTVK